MAFSIDSILAAVALSTRYWVIITGGVLGIITMRYVAGLVIALIDRFPALERTAFMLVGVIGIKLTLSGFDMIIDGKGRFRSECTVHCGDGIIGLGEECDDGENDGGYGECQPGCVLAEYCGDGIVQEDEDCDDGNFSDDDACPSSCQLTHLP